MLGGVTDGRAVVSNVLKHASSFQDIFKALIMYIFCKSYSWSDIEVIGSTAHLEVVKELSITFSLHLSVSIWPAVAVCRPAMCSAVI